MKLLTQAIKKQLAKYPLRSQDGKKGDALCICKFFLCQGAWTWYVLEANLETKELFGVVINGDGEGEYGYFSLDELEHLKSQIGLGVERDLYFTPKPLKEIHDYYLCTFLKNFQYE